MRVGPEDLDILLFLVRRMYQVKQIQRPKEGESAVE